MSLTMWREKSKKWKEKETMEEQSKKINTHKIWVTERLKKESTRKKKEKTEVPWAE